MATRSLDRPPFRPVGSGPRSYLWRAADYLVARTNTDDVIWAPPLGAHLGYWLRFVSNHVSYAFARKLADKDVTAAEWVVLHELYGERAVAPSSLADRLGLTRGAISNWLTA